MPRLRLASLALLPLLGGCMGDTTDRNFGVNSVNQPIVANGRASVPNCPNWRSAGRDSAAMTDTNYGCATNSNLAAMVADPNDLIHGKASPATEADVATRSIRALNAAPPGTGAAAPAASPKGN